MYILHAIERNTPHSQTTIIGVFTTYRLAIHALTEERGIRFNEETPYFTEDLCITKVRVNQRKRKQPVAVLTENTHTLKGNDQFKFKDDIERLAYNLLERDPIATDIAKDVLKI